MPSEIQSELPLPDDQYNTGDKDDKRAALTMVATYATSLLTLATATIALSATFIKDLYQGQDLWALLMAWGLLAASMVAAFLTLGQNISLLAESDLRPRRGLIEILGLVHRNSGSRRSGVLRIFRGSERYYFGCIFTRTRCQVSPCIRQVTDTAYKRSCTRPAPCDGHGHSLAGSNLCLNS